MKAKSKMEFYVAPWALAGEELPIHLKIDSDFKFDRIQIETPKDLSIRELLNVRSFQENENILTIESLFTANYFGFVVTQDTLFDETSCEKPIIIRFQKKKKIVQEVSIKTKFYRPHIISDSIQNNLVITDGCDLSSLLNLKIRVFGFGKIKMIVEVNTEEDTKVVMESYFKNLIQQAVATYSTDEEVAPEDERYSDTERILKAADAGYKSAGISDDIREKNLRDFREFLTNTKNSAKIIEEISKALENIFLEMLLFQFEKYPVDGVELSYGSPTLFASKFGDTMTIRFRYWDSMNNEYSPLDVVFNIDDQRTDKKPSEIPINIEWIRDPFEILIGDGTIE